MKKALRITLISLGSLLAVLTIAIVVVCNFLFSKEQLTKITKDFAQRYVTCETQIGDVELTFFSSFPNLSLCLNDVAVIHPMEGAQNDTLLGVHRLYATIDVMAFLKENRVNVTGFSLVESQANIYINADSVANYDVFAFDADTTTVEDTTSGGLSLERIRLRDIVVEDLSATYLDMAHQMEGRCKGLNLTLSTGANLQKLRGRGKMELDIQELFYSDSLNYGQLSGLELNGCRLRYTGDTATVKISDMKVASQEYLLSGETALLAKIWNMRLEDVDGMWADNRPTFKGVTLLDSSEVSLGKEDLTYVKTGAVKLDLPVSSTPERWTTQVDVLIQSLFCSVESQGVLANNIDLSTQMTASTNSQFNDFVVENMVSKVGSQAVTGGVHVDMTDTTVLKADVDVTLKATTIDDILAMVPAQYLESLKGMTLKGNLSDARVQTQLELTDVLNLKHVSVASNLSQFHYNDDANLNCDIQGFDAKVTYPAGNQGKQFSVEGNLQRLDVTMKDDTTNLLVNIPSGNAKLLLFDDIMDGKDLRLSADVNLSGVSVAMDDTVALELKSPVGAADIDMAAVKNCIKVAFKGQLGGVDVKYGKMLQGETSDITMNMTCLYDDRKTDVLDMVNPVADLNLKSAKFMVDGFDQQIIIPGGKATFNKDRATLSDFNLHLGNSNMALTGVISNINDWMKNQAKLEGELKLKSDLVDAGQLMDMVSGMGCDEGVDNNANDDSTKEQTNVSDADPFMVPQDVKFVVTTDVKTIKVNENSFENVAGQLTIDDGVLVLEEMGFTSKAARMQLTALYKSQKKNNLFVNWNFHLLDIDIAEMINLVPDIDTIVPMLSSFAGKAEFHLVGETALWGDYSPKLSTLKAAAAIEGHDLVVMDSETFRTIKKYLFSEKTENKIDSMSVEMVVDSEKASLYPMLVSMDKYQAVISGFHRLNDAMPFNYHISITKCPLVGGHVGLDITGNLEDTDNISFKLGSCKYANLYRPAKRNVTQEYTLRMKDNIRTALKRTVK